MAKKSGAPDSERKSELQSQFDCGRVSVSAIGEGQSQQLVVWVVSASVLVIKD